MYKNSKLYKITGWLTLVVFFCSAFLPGAVLADNGVCSFERENRSPSIESARLSIKTPDLKCAEKELLSFLEIPDISNEEKATAHILLGQVYFELVNKEKKREKTLKEFEDGFRAYLEWTGSLEIKRTELQTLLEEAKQRVELEIEAQKSDSLLIIDKGKPWYKKWWVIGSGVGVVALAAVFLAGGGSDDNGDPVVDTIPDFPNPPSKR